MSFYTLLILLTLFATADASPRLPVYTFSNVYGYEEPSWWNAIVAEYEGDDLHKVSSEIRTIPRRRVFLLKDPCAVFTRRRLASSVIKRVRE
jgi:hypothetical protein